jgi:hypothetical protein
MTLAVCFLTPEGVVLGADSAITYMAPSGGERYLSHAQKVFQVDDAGTLAVATFGAGSLASTSYRTVIARLGDEMRKKTGTLDTVRGAAAEFQTMLTQAAPQAFAKEIADALAADHKRQAGTPLTLEEANALVFVQNWYAGFYVAGRNRSDRAPAACHVALKLLGNQPAVTDLAMGWQMNANMIPQRLVKGWADDTLQVILNAKNANDVSRWSGSTIDDLKAALAPLEFLINPAMPIREAVDFVHFIITATVKMIKFAQLPPAVGGPVEVAVITTDRPLRWVRHKTFDAAL